MSEFNCIFNVVLNFVDEFGDQTFDIELSDWPKEDKLIEIICEGSTVEELNLLHLITVYQYTDNPKLLLPFIKYRNSKIFFIKHEKRIDFATEEDEVDEDYLQDLERWWNLREEIIRGKE
jgi:hypothetical protein